jgi:signal transduction histidine kinase/CheY-like chemotaxis protein
MAETKTEIPKDSISNKSTIIAGFFSFSLIFFISQGAFGANYTAQDLVLEVSTLFFLLILFMLSLFKFSEIRTGENFFVWIGVNVCFWMLLLRNILLPLFTPNMSEEGRWALLAFGNTLEIGIFVLALLGAVLSFEKQYDGSEHKNIIMYCLSAIFCALFVNFFVMVLLPKIYKMNVSLHAFSKFTAVIIIFVQLMALAVVIVSSVKYITKNQTGQFLNFAISSFFLLCATLPLSKVATGQSIGFSISMLFKTACFMTFVMYFANEYRNAIQQVMAGTGTIKQKVSEKIQLIERQREAMREKTIESREATRIKSELLANMSHELRTPMNSIIGFTSRVIKKTEGIIPEQQIKNLRTVERNAYQLLSLINTILDVSKIEAGRMDVFSEDVQVKELVSDVIEMGKSLIGRKEIELVADVPEEVTIFSDRTKIKQILVNLMGNAIKFTEHGEIRISVEKSSNIYADATKAPCPGIKIAVKDTGIGINKEDLPFIFDDYKQVDGSLTRKTGGTGLGLALVKRFAMLLGGGVTVESEYERGTTFNVLLPFNAEKVKKIEDPAKKISEATKKIIVFYDAEEGSLEEHKDYLAKKDFEVIALKSIDDTFAFCKEHYPRIVNIDILAPEKKGGELIRKLKENFFTKDIQFCFSKLYHNNKYGYFVNVVDLVYKPVNKELVSNVINIAARVCQKLHNILVVEHDEGALQLLHTLLLQEGEYNIRIARNHKEAMAMLTKKIPDVILCNIFMPEGEGFKIIADIGTNRKLCTIPVICIVPKMVDATHLKQSLENIAFLPEKSDLKKEDVGQKILVRAAGVSV